MRSAYGDQRSRPRRRRQLRSSPQPHEPQLATPANGGPRMDSDQQADRDQWETMLNQLTDQHAGEQITIEILDPTLGDQVEAERLPFTYATYDRRDDTIVIAVGGKTPRYPVLLRHMITKP